MEIYRVIFRAYIKPGAKDKLIADIKAGEECMKEALAQHDWIAMSVFVYENTLLLYGERRGNAADPGGLFTQIERHLLDIVESSGRKWRRMWEIFHYSGIRGEDKWRRKIPGKTAEMRLNHVRHEMFSSYVFYHYQLQEEYPGKNDKYGIICFDDGLMGFYQEHPVEADEDPPIALLSTKNSPLEIWQELMGKHFVPWEDFDQPWKPMQCLFSVIPAL